jgi:cytochrome c oxidase subunit 1
MGHLHGYHPGAAGLPRCSSRHHDDPTRRWHEFLPARPRLEGSTGLQRRGAALFSICSSFRPSRVIVALPAFGIVSDHIPSMQKNIFGYRMMVWALSIGGLSFMVWAHHMYVSGMNPYFGFFFATTTLIIAVPTALKVYNWVLTLWRGNIHFTVPMMFAIGFIFTFINGGLTGLFLGNVPVDLPLSDTMFVVAHFHMVMAVSPILVVFGAIYHWYPKVTGRMLNDTMGKFHFWVTFLGTYAIYYPMHYLGFLGVPRRYYAITGTDFIPQSAHSLNVANYRALVVGASNWCFCTI